MDQHGGLRVINGGSVRPAHTDVKAKVRPAHIFLVPYLDDSLDDDAETGLRDADQAAPLNLRATN